MSRMLAGHTVDYNRRVHDGRILRWMLAWIESGARYSWCASRQASDNSLYSVCCDGSDSGHRRSSKRP